MRETSFKGKLLALVLFAIGTAQAVVVGFALWGEAERYAFNKKALLLAEAHVLGAAVSNATAMHDRRGVYEGLRAAGRLPDIKFVSVDDLNGVRIAELGAAEILSSDLMIEAATPLSGWDLLRARSFALRAPIVQGGAPVGNVVLIGDAGDLKTALESGLRTSIGAAAAAMLLALAIVLRTQRILTRPLGGLVKAMQSVAASHNYALSAPHSEISELNILIDGFNGMLSEIRERDARIARNYAELEQQVADRTRDLSAAKDAAEAAKAMADQANAHKSSFLATMSHEIRTPMNGMLVMAELLTRAQLPASAQRYAEVIWRSGKSLLAIINDILDFSKIEAGKLELERTSVDLADMTTSVLDLFSEKARAKGLDLAARISVDAPRSIVGDPVRLTQVLTNLVNNAIKFTDQGGVRLRIEPGDEPDGLRFAVEDTGVGIPQDKLASIFGAFSQADMSTTRKYGGTGLGLAISQRLVEAMGSEFAVASELGKGSVFSFTLRGCAETSAPWPTAGSSDLPQPIGIVADGELTRDALLYYLSSAGIATEIILPEELPRLAPGRIVIAENAAAPPARPLGSRWIAIRRPGDALDDASADATLSWPIARAEVERVIAAILAGEALGAPRRTQTRHAQRPFVGVNALVADDNEINQEVARTALEQLGANVTIACDGAEAVSAYEAARFDIVFLDGSMPVMDGFEAARRIRQSEARAGFARTPIIALTAHVLGSRATAWRDAGMDDIITKPFTLEQLRRCIEAALPHRAGAPDAAQASTAPTPASQDLLDRNTLDELARMSSNGKPDFLGRVMRLYTEHAPGAVENIRQAAAAGDCETLAKAAHALKSMSLNIGANQVAAHAARLELRARNRDLPDAEDLSALVDVTTSTCQAISEQASARANPAPFAKAVNS